MKRSISCRRRRWSDSDLHRAARAASSMAGTLRALGLRAAGANYESINRSIKRLSIDTTHWTGKGHLKGRANPWARRAPIIEILKRDTFYQSNKLRKRLLKENILPARCAFCGLDEWLGEKIPLELDHIDGCRENNSLGNLRLLCPNCHSRTPTYRGRNIAARRLRSEPVSYA
jgi:Zn finger protein HypA/HybF involved in hydrogenase expression